MPPIGETEILDLAFGDAIGIIIFVRHFKFCSWALL